MSKYRLTRDAQESLKKIERYSINTFGNRQTFKYLNLLANSMQRIAENPEIGKDRAEILAGLQSYPSGSHVIYYRKPLKGQVEIIDVLHESMEPDLYF